MRFYKYCGAGNDFVLLDSFDGAIAPADAPELARRLCDRHFGVGADGLMLALPPERGGDCRMLFYNSDGSAAEMCGNGARCICRFCCERGLSGQTQRIETPAGIVTGVRLSANCYRIRLNSPTVIRLQQRAVGILCDYLELGEPGIPHAVVPMPKDADRTTLRQLAQTLRHAPEFPRGANVNLYERLGAHELRLLTFERGVEDFTLACGTGNGATAAALQLRGELGEGQTLIHNEGGDLLVDITLGSSPQIDLSGQALLCFTGEINEKSNSPKPL